RGSRDDDNTASTRVANSSVTAKFAADKFCAENGNELAHSFNSPRISPIYNGTNDNGDPQGEVVGYRYTFSSITCVK
ncbi:MAG: hypothetical protein HRT44_12210, partial [Bdellovibrionales bacterium]|nr:hypothetical protein [Bdellovibrionales bacterium]NQZ20002.1 hypothetical protein [Bdellovibrionales bacterium]